MLRVLPLVAAALAAVVISTCIAMAKARDHVPRWMHFPPISLGGYKDPERTLYAIGFSAVAALFCVMAPSMRRRVRASNRRTTRRATDVATALAFAAFAGLCAQAIVPLQPDILDVVDGRASLSAQSLVHQLGAAVFFAASLLHGFLVVWILDHDDTLLCSRALQPRAWWCKVVSLCALVVPAVIAFTFHPAGMNSEHVNINVRGPGPSAPALRARPHPPLAARGPALPSGRPWHASPRSTPRTVPTSTPYPSPPSPPIASSPGHPRGRPDSRPAPAATVDHAAATRSSAGCRPPSAPDWTT